MIEVLRAKKYYGKHATGTVVLINGQPYHFTALKDVRTFANTLHERQIASARIKFEEWISSGPYEKDISRYPDDAEKHAWPGAYKDINVCLAWHAWQEAAGIELCINR